MHCRPPGVGSNLQFRINVADQWSVSAATARFSYATPTIVRMIPSTAPTFSDPTRPTKITLQTLNMPVTDPKSIIRISMGRPPYNRLLDLDVYPRTNATWQTYRNRDGTYNLTFELPRDGAGDLTCVQVRIEPINTGSGYTPFPVITTPVNGVSLFRYLRPLINNIILVKTRWRTGVVNSSDAFSDITFPCPIRIQGPAWNCTDPSLYTLVLYGENFGGPPSSYTGIPTSITDSFNVIRSVEYGTRVGNTSTVNYAAAAQQANTFFLVSWDHTRIIVLTRRTSGFVRVTLSAPNATGTTNVAVNVAKEYMQLSPNVISVSPSSGIPTTGNVLLTISAQNLLGADGLSVYVGNANCTVVDGPSLAAAPLTSPSAVGAYLANPLNFYMMGADQTWRLYCILPPGQGTGQAVRVVRSISGGYIVEVDLGDE